MFDQVLQDIQKRRPLIVHLIDPLSMDFVANSMLAIGAVPVMAACIEELESLIEQSDCIHIGLGSLHPEFIERIAMTAVFSERMRKPLILDSCGSTETSIRTRTARHMLSYAHIVFGNARDMISLNQNKTTLDGQEAQKAALHIAMQYHNTVVLHTSKIWITNGRVHQEYIKNHHLMSLVNGMNCAVSALAAAFRSVVSSSYEASCLTADYCAYCAQQAAQKTPGPGSFRASFLDSLYGERTKHLNL